MVAIVVDYSLLPANPSIVINANGGAHTRGKAFSLEQKAYIASVYEAHRLDAAENNGGSALPCVLVSRPLPKKHVSLSAPY